MAPEPVQVPPVPTITTNGTPPERQGTLATANTASPHRSPSPSLPPIQPPYLPKSIPEGLLAAPRRSMSPHPRQSITTEVVDDGTSANPAAILTSPSIAMSKPSDGPNAAPPAPGPKLPPIETTSIGQNAQSGPSVPNNSIENLTSPHSATSASAESGLTATAGIGGELSPVRSRLDSIEETINSGYLAAATPSTPFSPITGPNRGSQSYPDPALSGTLGGSRGKHECPNCHQTFTRHHNLKSHLLTHSHEKPFQCVTCQSRFRRLHDLKRHQKLHTGERPHVCTSCGRRFARGDALARHLRGEGGCAGRRTSMTDGYDPDGMDGLEGTGDGDEEMGDYDPTSPSAIASRKAISLPHSKSRSSFSRVRAAARTQQAQNLQPAPLPAHNVQNHTYPPPPGSFAAPQPPSHKNYGPAVNTNQSSSGGPSILHESLTDSPRALSPSNPGFGIPPNDATSLGPPTRSPSYTSGTYHQSDSRRPTVGPNNPPSGGYSLPQPTQLSPRSHNAPLPGSLSRPGSFSSTHLAPPDPLAPSQSNMFASSEMNSVWSHIREMEKRIRDLEERNQNLEAKVIALQADRQGSIAQIAQANRQLTPTQSATGQESA